MGLTGGEGLPNDAEQKAANEGVVTDAQIQANENMRGQIAKKVQSFIDTKRVDANAQALQSGFVSVQEKAKAARTQGISSVTCEVKPKVQSKKTGLLSWLAGE